MKPLLRILSFTLLEAPNGFLAQLPLWPFIRYDDGCHLFSYPPCQLSQRLQGTQEGRSEMDLRNRSSPPLSFPALRWQFPNRRFRPLFDI